MEIKWLQTQSQFARFILALTVTICCLCIAMFLGVIIGMGMFNMGFSEIMGKANMDSVEGINILKLFQFTQSVGLFVIPPFVMYWLWGQNVNAALFINNKPAAGKLLLIILLIVSAMPVINIMAFYNEKMLLPQFLGGLEQWMQHSEEVAKQLTTAFLQVDNLPAVLVNLFIMAVLPAVGEEFFFRGLMQDIFVRLTKNIHFGILIGAFFFSAFHMQFYGFLPRFALGIMFGYLLVWSGSMWVTIFAHFINNAMAVLYFYINSKYSLPSNIDTFGTTPNTRIWLVVSVVMVSLILYYFYYNRKIVNK